MEPDHGQKPQHETSDVHIGTLVKFIVILAISTVVILIAMQIFSDFLEEIEESRELPPASRVNPPGTQRLPPLPRLQGAPGSEMLPLDDMKKFKAEQEQALSSYAWVDKQAGTVRLPIEQAKRIYLERLKSNAAAAPAATPAPTPAGGTAGSATRGGD